MAFDATREREESARPAGATPLGPGFDAPISTTDKRPGMVLNNSKGLQV